MKRTFVACRRTVVVDGTPLMGIVNASPESFSGDGSSELQVQVDLALRQVAAGALVVDIGGQSANTRTPTLAVEDEVARVVPLIEAVRAASDAVISVDTYKPAVADACLAAGADVINDVSGLHHPELADVVASWGAGYVLMHTVGPPKSKILDPHRYDDVVSAVLSFVDAKLSQLATAGVDPDQVIVDPGLDFGKTPRQSLELVHRAGALHAAIEGPLLFAISRKDFIGAIAMTGPLDRAPGTLAVAGALAAAAPSSLLRVHDVAGTAQYLAVRAAIDAPEVLDPGAVLPDHLRRV
ncbi:MAG TPA: dihydropteroate synthase [Acidimicrobiales bacterium]|nr:dihydropteroate synthase [Acidimicrobiales bacterium]